MQRAGKIEVIALTLLVPGGFPAPLRPWLEATLSSERARSIPALNLPEMQRTWAAVLAGKQPFDFRVWRWVNLIRWAERFDVSFAA